MPNDRQITFKLPEAEARFLDAEAKLHDEKSGSTYARRLVKAALGKSSQPVLARRGGGEQQVPMTCLAKEIRDAIEPLVKELCQVKNELAQRGNSGKQVLPTVSNEAPLWAVLGKALQDVSRNLDDLKVAVLARGPQSNGSHRAGDEPQSLRGLEQKVEKLSHNFRRAAAYILIAAEGASEKEAHDWAHTHFEN